VRVREIAAGGLLMSVADDAIWLWQIDQAMAHLTRQGTGLLGMRRPAVMQQLRDERDLTVERLKAGADAGEPAAADEALTSVGVVQPTQTNPPRVETRKGAAGIAGLRADLADGSMTVERLRAATSAELAVQYRISVNGAEKMKRRVLKEWEGVVDAAA
jgi:hypothetical protein